MMSAAELAAVYLGLVTLNKVIDEGRLSPEGLAKIVNALSSDGVDQQYLVEVESFIRRSLRP